MNQFLQRIWKDPVWSKVIANGIWVALVAIPSIAAAFLGGSTSVPNRLLILPALCAAIDAVAHWGRRWLSEAIRQWIEKQGIRATPIAILLVIAYVIVIDLHTWLEQSPPSPVNSAQVLPGSAKVADVSPTSWGKLNPSQALSLERQIRLIPPRPIMVACESIDCRDLADDFVEVLNKGGWRARPYHGGGLGITGVTGLRLDQDGVGARSLKDAIENTTGLKVETVPVPTNMPEPQELNFVVGIKPF